MEEIYKSLEIDFSLSRFFISKFYTYSEELMLNSFEITLSFRFELSDFLEGILDFLDELRALKRLCHLSAQAEARLES
jgi:hypothetical protein